MTASWDSSSQLRRCPTSRPSKGMGILSTSGAQANLRTYAAPARENQPISVSEVPSSRSHAESVAPTSSNGKPLEKPSKPINRTFFSRCRALADSQACIRVVTSRLRIRHEGDYPQARCHQSVLRTRTRHHRRQSPRRRETQKICFCVYDSARSNDNNP